MLQLPDALYSIAQMRELDRRAIEKNKIAARELMARAGAAAWQSLRQRWPKAKHIVVFAGAGNNAGDGYVLAALAQRAKCRVTVVTPGAGARLSGIAGAARKRYLALKGKEQKFSGTLPADADVIVDALFGIGLDRPLQDRWLEAVQVMNAAGRPVVSLDIPSGLHAGSGAALGAAVHASLTVTFIALKPGMFTGDGPACCGEVELAGLKVPAKAFADIAPAARLIADGEARLPRRQRSAHKGNFGHVLVIGGDHGMAGAVRLTAEAALRTGAGLVSVITRPLHVSGLLAGLPEAMVLGTDDPADIMTLLARATVVAIGPGLGQSDWARILLARVLDTPLPLVVDADALNLLAAHPLTRGQWILTPHPGEAGRLLQQPAAQVQKDRLQAAWQIAEKYRAVAVLKGAGSIVAEAPDTPAICRHGNPGMAAPGMGDALTGVIAALVAQGLPLAEAARAGVELHALAGDQAAQSGERGLLARDLIGALRVLVNR
ncbi:MAG: NAD(P)H-hydrate dehydratase [Gammaproteobacteria bacterium]|nr:NAD(P)H-hydrate dehydratase [Gammaproteobacteria bacterium]MBU6510176.1 NAD(P)H-hydrate dehydratase [Gammaproteobacteria bacterium]MDE1983929.1 NAD(P)H-hydrate dehydratase [Gammaproteobacteria bacterium]